MSKAGGDLRILLLLVACAAAATWPVLSARLALAPAPALGEDSMLVGGDPNLIECWKSLFAVQNCVSSIFATLFGGNIPVGSDCCRAIGWLDDYCVPWILGYPVFGGVFPLPLQTSCAAAGPAPAPSTAHAR